MFILLGRSRAEVINKRNQKGQQAGSCVTVLGANITDNSYPEKIINIWGPPLANAENTQ
jgi:hypothetical protein